MPIGYCERNRRFNLCGLHPEQSLELLGFARNIKYAFAIDSLVKNFRPAPSILCKRVGTRTIQGALDV